MPRPMLHRSSATETHTNPLSLMSEPKAKEMTEEQKAETYHLLKKQRSKAYMDAIHQLDAGGHVMNAAACEAIRAAVAAEFQALAEISMLPIGIVAECCLGGTYEVHTFSMSGGIIEHYQKGVPLPDGMERARALAMHGAYAFIEVYSDILRAIGKDGSVAVVR